VEEVNCSPGLSCDPLFLLEINLLIISYLP
jgi:hypothetical protein